MKRLLWHIEVNADFGMRDVSIEGPFADRESEHFVTV